MVEARAGDPRDIPAYTAAPMRRHTARPLLSPLSALPLVHATSERHAQPGAPRPGAARIPFPRIVPRILDYRTVRERLNQIRTTTGTRPRRGQAGPICTTIGPDLSRSDDRSYRRLRTSVAERRRAVSKRPAARRAARSRRRGSAEPVDPPRRRAETCALWAIRSSRVSGTAAGTQKAGIPV